MKPNATDCLWVVMSRRDRLSYHPAMSKVPGYMEQFFAGTVSCWSIPYRRAIRTTAICNVRPGNRCGEFPGFRILYYLYG